MNSILDIELMQSMPREWYSDEEFFDEEDGDLDQLALDELFESPSKYSEILSLPSVTLASRGDLPDAPGVYFVRDDREILFYVGQSKSLRTRWANHEKLPDFEQINRKSELILIHYLQTSDQKSVEIEMIKRFRPLMNYQIRKRIAVPSCLLEKDYQELAKAYEDLSEKYQSIAQLDKSIYDSAVNAAEQCINLVEENKEVVGKYNALLARYQVLQQMYADAAINWQIAAQARPQKTDHQ